MPPRPGAASVSPEDDSRFAFGENWARFLDVVDERRVTQAERALVSLLGAASLEGLTFLDVGSGSGLSAVAARRLGARVHAFDYDPRCVACTAELARRHAPGGEGFTVEQGSILDTGYLSGLGTFDVVHAWGVLHHTGAMEDAVENTIRLVAPGGRLVLALYNDQGWKSDAWRAIKRVHRALPARVADGWIAIVMIACEAKAAAGAVLRGRLRTHVRRFSDYSSHRGMSLWHDWRDWVGGWPYEVAVPEGVIASCRERGLELATFRGCDGGWGCNEFTFARTDGAAS